MHRLILFAALFLTACSAPNSVVGFRDPASPIYSNAVLTQARLIGQWAQVADFATADTCRSGAVVITSRDGGLHADGRLCVAGVATPVKGPMMPAGPGRFAVSGISDPWWVLWVDTDARTLVIGTPSGRFGFILNRTGGLPSDRLVAAKEVLDFNGYDPSRLRVFP